MGLNFDYILHYAQMYKWSAIEWAAELQSIQLYISTNTYTAAIAVNTPGRVTSTFQSILLIQQIMQAVRTCKAKSSPPHGAPARGVSQPPVASSFFEESRCEEQEREAQPSNAASSLVLATRAPSKIASHLRLRFAAEQQQVSFCLILRWLRRCLYATKCLNQHSPQQCP